MPGVRGIGIKTAAELIGIYGDIETLIARAAEIKQNKRRETIIENAENARISLRLVTLDDKVPLKEKPDGFAVQEPEAKELIGFLKAMEFTSIVRRAAAHFQIDDPDAIAADTKVAPRREPKLLDPAEADGAAAAPAQDPALRAPITPGAEVMQPMPTSARRSAPPSIAAGK